MSLQDIFVFDMCYRTARLDIMYDDVLLAPTVF